MTPEMVAKLIVLDLAYEGGALLSTRYIATLVGKDRFLVKWAAKECDGRVAVYWLRPDQTQLVEVVWALRSSDADAVTVAADLNAFVENERGEIPSFSVDSYRHYDVALSYASEDRPRAEEIARALQRAGKRVFFDHDLRSSLWGKELGEELDAIFSKRSTFCVLLVSEHYKMKRWTLEEFQEGSRAPPARRGETTSFRCGSTLPNSRAWPTTSYTYPSRRELRPSAPTSSRSRDVHDRETSNPLSPRHQPEPSFDQEPHAPRSCRHGAQLVYRSNAVHPCHQANFRVFDPLDCLAELSAHLRDAHERTTLVYGRYSNRARGYRKRHGLLGAAPPTEPAPEGDTRAPLDARRSWARLIRKVSEVDPLLCARGGGAMEILAEIERPAVVQQIHAHLGLPTGPASLRASPDPRGPGG